MRHFFKFVEGIFLSAAGLAVGLIILFAIIHVLKTNSVTGSTPVGTGAAWVGSHATNY